MEARCNALIFVGILATLASLQNAEPASDLDQRNPGTATLTRLEDAFATDPGNRALARRLAEGMAGSALPDCVTPNAAGSLIGLVTGPYAAATGKCKMPK